VGLIEQRGVILRGLAVSNTQLASGRQLLGLLAFLHYVLAGFAVAIALLMLVLVLSGLHSIVFMLVGLAGLLISSLFTVLLVMSAQRMGRRSDYWFSLLLSCLMLVYMLFGTLLGLFSLVVLCQGSVRQLYKTAAVKS
jgi:hypothetical protein